MHRAGATRAPLGHRLCQEFFAGRNLAPTYRRPAAGAQIIENLLVGQAKIMGEMIDVKKLFHLACPSRETLFYRLKKRALKDNRLDDANERVIQRRLDIYEKESKPVLSYYSNELVTVVDATQPPAKVLLDILKSLNGVYEPAAV